MKRILLLFFLFFSFPFYGQSNQPLPLKKGEKQTEGGCYGTINGISGYDVKMQKERFKNAIIGFQITTKNEKISDDVIGFSIKIPNVQAKKISGNKIDDSTFQKILRIASKGDKITIFDIKTKIKPATYSGPICDPAFPLVIEIY